MGLNKPSRRDDLISLAYLLLYMMNELPYKNVGEESESFEIKFHLQFKAKRQHCPYTLSKTPRASILVDFFKEIWSYDYETEPSYGKLRHLLALRLIDMGHLPNKDIYAQK